MWGRQGLNEINALWRNMPYRFRFGGLQCRFGRAGQRGTLMSFRQRILIVAVLVAAAAGGAYYWWQQQQNTLPAYIAVGNGRIEAEEVQVAAKYAGRVAQVLVDEGDMVKQGQVLARMDTAELQASLAKAKADVAQATEAVAEARALIVQRESELKYAQQELAYLQTIGRSEADRAGHRPGGARSGPRAPRQQRARRRIRVGGGAADPDPDR
jgi:HlyD family secretion protein